MKKLLLSLLFATSCLAQVGTNAHRNPVYTDDNGNVRNSPLTFSNLFSVIPMSTSAVQVVNYNTLTNALKGATNGVSIALTNSSVQYPFLTNYVAGATNALCNVLTNYAELGAQNVFRGVTNEFRVTVTTNIIARTWMVVGTNVVAADEYGSTPIFWVAGKYRMGADGGTYSLMCYTNIAINTFPSIGGNSSYSTNFTWDDVHTNSFISGNSTIISDNIVVRYGCTNENKLILNFLNISTSAKVPSNQVHRVNALTP